MTRYIKRLSYADAASELAEADERADRCRTELSMALRDQQQALANVLDALSRIATGTPTPE